MRRSTFALVVLAALLAACSEPVVQDGGPSPTALPRNALDGTTASTGPLAAATGLTIGKCMDVWGAGRDAGTPVVIWPCHGGPNQQFTFPDPGTTGEIRADGAMCLDAYTGLANDGDPAVIWSCHGGPNQQWTVTAAGEIRGVGGKCLDVYAVDPSDGARLVIWSCHGGANQRWTVAAEEPAAVLVGTGDIASCTSDGDEQTSALIDTIPGVVFIPGDIAYPDGSAEDFANCYDPSWGRHRARTRPAPGNHEYVTPGASAYYAYFGEAAGAPGVGYYSYDVGRWHIVSLNSNGNSVLSGTSAQAAWLRADLAAHPTACTLAYWHHPRFSSGSATASDARLQPLFQILYDAGADVVVSGHLHNYERFAPQTPTGQLDRARGIREFIAGLGGASRATRWVIQPNSEVRYNAAYGVLRLELRAASYGWTFISANGTVEDSGAGACH